MMLQECSSRIFCVLHLAHELLWWIWNNFRLWLSL